MELAMGHRQRAAELLAKADRYRVHARSLSDRETAGRIWDLTDEMERQAQHLIKMLKEECIRTRAHQIWQQHNEAGQKQGVELRQSYARVGKLALIQHQRYAHAKQFKRANRALRTLKTYLGRVIRDIARKPASATFSVRCRRNWA
jgi:hypothetical protein